MNVLAVKTLTDYVGETESYDYLLNFGFTTLSEDDKYSQAKALGGITNGVYNIEKNISIMIQNLCVKNRLRVSSSTGKSSWWYHERCI